MMRQRGRCAARQGLGGGHLQGEGGPLSRLPWLTSAPVCRVVVGQRCAPRALQLVGILNRALVGGGLVDVSRIAHPL